MRCVASSFGSLGDFLPTLAVGAALRRRGHTVRFVANPIYASRVERAGLDFVPAGVPSDLFERIERTPEYVAFENAGKMLHELGAPDIEAVYPAVLDVLRADRADVVVAADVSFGARWAAAESGVASVMVRATPVFWMSWHAPAVVGLPLPSIVNRPLTVGLRSLMRWYLTRFLRPLARRLGCSLPDVSFQASERMAAIQLGMWSPDLRGPIAGDPPNGMICGFVRGSALGGTEPGMPPEVQSFLAAGPPPVVVGLGSAFALIAGDMLGRVAAACAAGGRRCLILGHPTGMTFPPNTLAVRYAPYDRVFSRAAAVVVHGGAGTTGEALRAGRPIVGVPFAYDQFTLCAGIERLGMGVRVRRHADVALALERVLSDEAMGRRASDAGARFAAERDGAEVGADAVEALVARRAQVGG